MLVCGRAIAGFSRVKVRVGRMVGKDGVVRVVREMGVFIYIAMEAAVVMLRERCVEAVAIVGRHVARV